MALIRTYDQVLEELKGLNCLIYSQKRSRRQEGLSVFFVKGCRYSLRVRRIRTWNSIMTASGNHESGELIILQWYFKTRKFKKRLKKIAFEDLLNSRYLSEKAKTELVFNIDLFRM